MTRQAPFGLPVPCEVSHITSHVSQPRVIDTKPSVQRLEPHICRKPTCAIMKVWETTELLEHILTFLPTHHLLPLRSVKRSWNGLILESPSFRLHLFVHPNWQHPATEFQLLHLSLPGLQIRRGSPVHLGHWVEVRINLEAAERILKDSGDDFRPTRSLMFFNDFEHARHRAPASQQLPRYADLFITQPPIVGIQAFVIDAHTTAFEGRSSPPDDHEPEAGLEVPAVRSKLSCDAGLTLGFLAEVARNLQVRHARTCDEKTVVFKAIVSFWQTDIAPRKRSGTRIVTELE